MARLAAQFNLLEEAQRVDARQRRSMRLIARCNAAATEIGEEEFVANYRVTKTIFLEIVEVLSPFLKAPTRSSDIPIKFKILVALSFYATGSYQRLVGTSHGTVMSQQTVSRCIREVTNALNKPEILQKYIKFPANADERNAIKIKFYEKYGIPGVIGCIDGTHVAMVRPSENEEWYFNRKQYHSRNVQIICDFDLNIISVDACFGGATHDSHIFNQHAVKNHLIDLVNRGETVCLLGATKEIGTALTRVCLRHRAIETRMKTFISALMDTLITPLSERADEWRRGGCATGALSREHARECKRARAELRRRVHEAQRHARKARRAPPDAKRRADVCLQDVQERKQQLEEMEEKAVKAALIEERSRFCHFVSLLNPVVESEVAMLAEVGHLQEGTEQLIRHTAEPRTLPAASLQVICDIKSCYSGWAESSSAPHSPSASRLGSRKSSLTSISSLNSQCSEQIAASCSTVSCSTPLSGASSAATLPAPDNAGNQSAFRFPSVCSADSGFRSQDALQRRSLYVDNGLDNQSVSSECIPAKHIEDDNTDDDRDAIGNAASATWPDLKDTAQFERAASAIMAARPHTISAAFERGHPRPALSVHTFDADCRDGSGIYARPPLPTRCSSLERPSVPAKSGNANTGQAEFKPNKPSSLPPHLTKEMPQALYVNMSELATLAASRAQQQQQQQHSEHPQQEKVCSESSASESSLESSSGYGSQGAFAAEDHALQHQIQHADVESEIVTLRRDSDASVVAARESFSISLGSLEEAVRSLDEACETPPFATIGKKPAVPKRRPVSMTASVWSRRGSNSSLGKPPPPVRRSSSISRPQRHYAQGNPQSPQLSTDADNLPPPPAFLLQPENDAAGHQGSVAETVKQLTELKHMPASPGLVRRSLQQLQTNSSPTQTLSTFQQAKINFSSNTSLSSSGSLNPIYGQSGHRVLACVESAARKGLQDHADLFKDHNSSAGSPHGSSPSTPSYGENNSFSSFGPRLSNDSHYGQTGFKLQQEKKYGQSNTIYAQPSQIIAGFNNMRHDTLSPLALRRNIAARSHSADRHADPGGLIASLSAKLAPQLSPRTTRRAISSITSADSPPKNKGSLPAAVQPAFLDKLSATIQQQRRQLDSSGNRANTVRDMINAHAQPDPRVCHTSLMEQIKRGATLRRNKHCNDRSAPKIR